jgi:NitT/TauT family transport system substrate-binding protein
MFDRLCGRLCRALIIALSVALPPAVFAEMAEIKVAKQYGISYLPLMLMEDGKLIEKHAKLAGVDVTVTWATFAGGNVMNDALLSSSLQVASGGVGPLVTLCRARAAIWTSGRSLRSTPCR